MGSALGVVKLHVVQVGKLRLADDRVALGAGVILCEADDQGLDIRLAVLWTDAMG